MGKEREQRLEVSELPPSVNRMFTVRNGRKVLSTEARRYKNKVKLELTKQLLTYKPLGHNTPIDLYIDFVFHDMHNKGFPKTAKTKFKKKDVSNKIKILEDVLCEVLDIDDSQVVRLEVHKWQGKKDKVLLRVRTWTGPLTLQS